MTRALNTGEGNGATVKRLLAYWLLTSIHVLSDIDGWFRCYRTEYFRTNKASLIRRRISRKKSVVFHKSARKMTLNVSLDICEYFLHYNFIQVHLSFQTTIVMLLIFGFFHSSLCASFSNVVVRGGSEVIPLELPLEYINYGGPISYTGPQFAQISAAPVETVVSLSNARPCVSPCIIANTPISGLAPIQTTANAQIVAYKSPVANVPIVLANADVSTHINKFILSVHCIDIVYFCSSKPIVKLDSIILICQNIKKSLHYISE